MESYIRNLVSYIKKNLAKGYPTDSLKWALISQGYSRIEIDKAIRITNEELAKTLPILKEKPVIKIELEPISQASQETFSYLKSLWRKIKDFFIG